MKCDSSILNVAQKIECDSLFAITNVLSKKNIQKFEYSLTSSGELFWNYIFIILSH